MGKEQSGEDDCLDFRWQGPLWLTAPGVKPCTVILEHTISLEFRDWKELQRLETRGFEIRGWTGWEHG